MTQTKCGFFSIVGATNTGKSTLTNLLVGSKISIVSPKVQTTRTTIKAITVIDNCQLIFFDTTGLFKAKSKLEKAILKEAHDRIAEDIKLIFLIDAEKGLMAEELKLIGQLQQEKRKAIFVINKVDLIKPNKLLPLADKIQDSSIAEEIFMISALNNDGVADLAKHLVTISPNSAFMYPEDQISDLPARFLAAEITREKLFLKLSKELPYSLSVVTELWKDDGSGKILIAQTIYVLKDSQKKIILGRGGQMIKEIGIMARKDIQETLGIKIHLDLFVKVKEDWTEKSYMYQDMGLKFPG